MIVTYIMYMYNSDDATMQTITIVNSHNTISSNKSMHITCTWTKLAILVTNPIVILQCGNKGGEGEGEVG